jgi:hypothetical protein
MLSPSSWLNNKPGKKPAEVNGELGLPYSSTLKMEAMFLLTTRRYNKEESSLPVVISHLMSKKVSTWLSVNTVHSFRQFAKRSYEMYASRNNSLLLPLHFQFINNKF